MFEGSVMENRGQMRGTAYMEGSVVGMGGGLFFAQRIDDSFAVIEGAGEHTPVLSNTRLATRTDRSGRALVPYLSSFQPNAVSIDPSEMPVDLKPARTEAVVIPGDRAGVIIDFGVARIAAAIVILVDSSGTPLPVGSTVLLEGMAEPAVVGFDGRTYLTDLGPHNSIRVLREDSGECSASFDFTPVAGEQIEIGPLACQ
jgi:outer membrane usher protein